MASNTVKANQGGMNFYLRVTLALVITAASTALMLSAVNLITEGRIAQNRDNEIISAMTAIYPDLDGYKTVEGEFSAPVKTVYSVGDDWCVVTAPKGFADKIELMIGITSDGEVAGISILDSSETPGIGSKIEGEYLDSFTGRKGSLILGANVDAVSGATYSSKAVIEGVNSALNAVKSLETVTTETEQAVESDDYSLGYVDPPNMEVSAEEETEEETESTETTAEAAE